MSHTECIHFDSRCMLQERRFLLKNYRGMLDKRRYDWGRSSQSQDNKAAIQDVVQTLKDKLPALADVDDIVILDDLKAWITSTKGNLNKTSSKVRSY